MEPNLRGFGNLGGGAEGGGGAGFGGAIFAKSGTLTLQNVTFNNNSASGGEGYEVTGNEDGQGMGGALFICTMTESCYECSAEFQEDNVSYSQNTASDDSPDAFIGGGNSSHIYGLHDGGLNNSQLFIINPTDGFAVEALGNTHIGHDLEGLAIHPENGKIYASSGDDPADDLPNGYIYEVNPDGTLTNVCSTGLREVSAMSFHPMTMELWVWADREGLFTIDLNDIDGSGVCAITEKATSKAQIEALTWDNDGNVLYGAAGTVLYQYNGSVTQVCEDFPSQVEALDMLADGSLLFGLHRSGDTSIHSFDIDECEVKYSAPLVGTPYTDIEGLAWTCPINN